MMAYSRVEVVVVLTRLIAKVVHSSDVLGFPIAQPSSLSKCS